MIGKLQRKLFYYKTLETKQTLNASQQQKRELYTKQLAELTSSREPKQQNKRVKYIIGELKFKTQKEANTYFQDYLQTHDDVDSNALCCVKRHPDWIEGSTVEIRPNETYPQYKNFVIIHPDGSENYVSVKTCIKGKYDASHVKKVFRRAILPQINAFIKTHDIPELCPSCHQYCERFEVDHVHPFNHILNDFVHENHIDLNSIKTIQHQSLPDFEDDELKNKWIKYHEEHAQLQYLCSKCNNKKKDCLL